MNEFLRQFVKKTIFKMIDNVPEWQVREYALGWYAKGILTEEDLAEIEERYNKPEEPVVAENETTEDATDTNVATIEEPVEDTEDTTEESEVE